MLTERLEIRAPIEADRRRFVQLFQDPQFMVFSDGVHDRDSANARFDQMLRTAREVSFAKRPLIERASGLIIGYSGAAWFDLEGTRRLEFGYRLVPEARGRGYATEAGRALMGVAAQTFTGDLFAMIDPRNSASKAVISKLDFTFWRQIEIKDYCDDLYRRTFA
jgi:RimJ/RimL family protein N-acetyltransferase